MLANIEITKNKACNIISKFKATLNYLSTVGYPTGELYYHKQVLFTLNLFIIYFIHNSASTSYQLRNFS